MGDNKEEVTGHLGVHKGGLIAAHEFLIIRSQGTMGFKSTSNPSNESEEFGAFGKLANGGIVRKAVNVK